MINFTPCPFRHCTSRQEDKCAPEPVWIWWIREESHCLPGSENQSSLPTLTTKLTELSRPLFFLIYTPQKLLCWSNTRGKVLHGNVMQVLVGNSRSVCLCAGTAAGLESLEGKDQLEYLQRQVVPWLRWLVAGFLPRKSSFDSRSIHMDLCGRFSAHLLQLFVSSCQIFIQFSTCVIVRIWSNRLTGGGNTIRGLAQNLQGKCGI